MCASGWPTPATRRPRSARRGSSTSRITTSRRSFPQFGRATYTLPEAKKKETDIKDFEGYVLTTFQLRGKATKLGYLRGDAEDGGCFYLYRKPFASLGVQAVHRVHRQLSARDGCGRRRCTRCTSPASRRTGRRRIPGSRTKLPLGKVPPVLLSECYNDIKQIAAEGTGFDPEVEGRRVIFSRFAFHALQRDNASGDCGIIMAKHKRTLRRCSANRRR